MTRIATDRLPDRLRRSVLVGRPMSLLSRETGTVSECDGHGEIGPTVTESYTCPAGIEYARAERLNLAR